MSYIDYRDPSSSNVVQCRSTLSIEISNIRNFKKGSKTCLLCWLSSPNVEITNIRNYKREIRTSILYWLSWLNIVQRWEIEYKKFQKRKWYLHTMLIIMIQHRPNLTIDMSNIRKYNKKIKVYIACWLLWSNVVQRCPPTYRI